MNYDILRPRNYHTDKDIMKAVKEHYDEACTIFPHERIVGIFLQGAQNYKLETYKSDVDTKVIVLPTLEDICLNSQPVSYTHVRVNNEHIDFKDIRLMMDCFRKENVYFLEILFTPYNIINPQYASMYSIIFDKAEEIARYNQRKFLLASLGTMKSKIKNMVTSRPNCAEEIEEYGYSAKELHHILRMGEIMQRYICGESFRDCLVSKRVDYLRTIKTNAHTIFNKDRAISIANHELEKMVKLIDDYFIGHPDSVNGANEEVDKLLKDVTMKIIKYSLRRELEKE